jgi:hypothetical protein
MGLDARLERLTTAFAGVVAAVVAAVLGYFRRA